LAKSVGSSAGAFELLTRFDTGQRCNRSSGAGFSNSTPALPPSHAGLTLYAVGGVYRPSLFGKPCAMLSVLRSGVGEAEPASDAPAISDANQFIKKRNRRLGVRKLRGFHRSPLFPARGSPRKTLTKNDPVLRAQSTLTTGRTAEKFRDRHDPSHQQTSS
jgi:hypothetical protein